MSRAPPGRLSVVVCHSHGCSTRGAIACPSSLLAQTEHTTRENRVPLRSLENKFVDLLASVRSTRKVFRHGNAARTEDYRSQSRGNLRADPALMLQLGVHPVLTRSQYQTRLREGTPGFLTTVSRRLIPRNHSEDGQSSLSPKEALQRTHLRHLPSLVSLTHSRPIPHPLYDACKWTRGLSDCHAESALSPADHCGRPGA